MTRPRPLSPAMKAHLWAMLKHINAKEPANEILMLNEQTAQALVRRGLLTLQSGGYVLDERKARAALQKSGT